ncbi:hypothetical protein ACQP1W_00805 [Spirillospora sp. CA-255316]
MATAQFGGEDVAIASYVPAENPPGWRRVAGEVRTVVATALPFTRYPAGELMGVLSKLALFADAEGQPIQADLWLTREYIERFVLVGCAHLGESSRANYRSKLLRLREAVLGGDCATGKPSRLSGSQASRPYTRVEQVALWAWACGQPTEELRNGLTVLISLGLGCGLGSSEIIPLRAGDVSVPGLDEKEDDQPTVVAVRGKRSRLVVCRRAWESILAGQAACAAARDTYLFRPGAARRGGNLVTNFLSRTHPAAGTPALKMSRLRATWLVSLIEAGLPLTVIVPAAGLETLHGMSRLMPYVGRVEASEVARLLRGG